jgi:hypothetical protein
MLDECLYRHAAQHGGELELAVFRFGNAGAELDPGFGPARRQCGVEGRRRAVWARIRTGFRGGSHGCCLLVFLVAICISCLCRVLLSSLFANLVSGVGFAAHCASDYRWLLSNFSARPWISTAPCARGPGVPLQMRACDLADAQAATAGTPYMGRRAMCCSRAVGCDQRPLPCPSLPFDTAGKRADHLLLTITSRERSAAVAPHRPLPRTGWGASGGKRTAIHSECGCYSMTSSARTRIDGGIVSPSAFAVLRLTTSLKVVGCGTGRSAGFAPFRILPA